MERRVVTARGRLVGGLRQSPPSPAGTRTVTRSHRNAAGAGKPLELPPAPTNKQPAAQPLPSPLPALSKLLLYLKKKTLALL